MKILIAILSIITLQACSQNTIKENPFKTQHVVNKSENHKRVKGTKLFAIIPDTYNYVSELSRYQISDQQFIQFQNIPNNSWSEYKTRLNKEVFGKGLTIYDQVTFNGFDGMYVEGEDPNSNKNDIVLIFGNDNFVTMIIAKTLKHNIEGRNELIQILKSIYYDESYSLDEFELANFEFDQSITNYELALAGNNLFMFAQNGKADSENPFANSLLFQTLPTMSYQQQMTYFKDMIERHKSKNIKLLNKDIQDVTIGNYKAIQLESEIEYQNKTGILNQVLINDGNRTLMFLGTGYDDVTNLKSIFNRTIETIKLK